MTVNQFGLSPTRGLRYSALPDWLHRAPPKPDRALRLQVFDEFSNSQETRGFVTAS